MKIAYLNQTGSYTHLDLFIVQWSNKRKAAVISGEPGDFKTNILEIISHLPDQKKNKKQPVTLGDFWHALAKPWSFKLLATVISSLPFIVALSRGAGVQSRKPKLCWIFYLLHHSYSADCPSLLYLLRFQCIYSRSAKLCSQFRHHCLPSYGSKVLRTQCLLQILSHAQLLLDKTGALSSLSSTVTGCESHVLIVVAFDTECPNQSEQILPTNYFMWSVNTARLFIWKCSLAACILQWQDTRPPVHRA